MERGMTSALHWRFGEPIQPVLESLSSRAKCLTGTVLAANSLALRSDLKTRFPIGGTIMGGKIDKVKGRIKEAAGVLTGNEELRAEGKADQAVGEAKEVVDKVKKVAENVVDDVKEAVKKLSE
jgi:uncharacterized protein YjbJ (UPF0337 family)